MRIDVRDLMVDDVIICPSLSSLRLFKVLRKPKVRQDGRSCVAMLLYDMDRGKEVYKDLSWNHLWLVERNGQKV